jgi:hypothetical protein
MSVSIVEFGELAKTSLARPAMAAKDSKALPDSAVVTACEAARAAMSAFDEAAKRGDGFGALCELSQSERSAVSAVCGTRSSTPAGIAEKALLLNSFLRTTRRSEVTQETVDFALSLANDAVKLAKTLAEAGTNRLVRRIPKS